MVAGADLAVKNFGTIPLNAVLQPAIRLARNGIPVSPKLNGMIAENYEKISKFPARASIYLADELPSEVGAILKNEQIAYTLDLLAEQGRGVFYQG